MWIYISTVEGFCYAVMIAWYDHASRHAHGALSGFISKIGDYSYSIYLFHFFFVFAFANWINDHISRIDGFYVMVFWSTIGFLLILPLSYLSYRFVEMPFLQFRRRYIISR